MASIFDGTLAEYHGWEGPDVIGRPIPAMVELVKDLLSKGEDVRIFTARVDMNVSDYKRPPDEEIGFSDLALVRLKIQMWCQEHIGRILPITCVKDYGMILLYDDRCIQVERNTGRLIL